MIRTSTAIGTVAVLMSLLVHFSGLNFAFMPKQEQSGETGASDVIELVSRFEDVAERVML